ncbi:asparagine synthase (glutamine-hydrolyzing) [Alsobacter soli]|uniref:asparagine synthase (glutamine-hydrolyzing) n=1 Tax=Alsobacter soli TaxID=2109933 RepID=A0A2T1HL93_9HYPH|nr:asparagine synthase (glutamine-hydrolyzing) [Alsobacter soli]PSC02426.1 asparagine synthase (glutamine-hydrolyzing) [Alsobacter soli]
MCGIFGWILRTRAKQTERLLQGLRDELAHRGPDQAGHVLTNLGDKWQIGLAHRRLSIIDLAAGAQPMESHDGKYVIIYNGEIYNYREIKEELIGSGHCFRTDSDTEVFIESFRRWGTRCFNKFRGMFAAAIFDKTENRVILCRDHFGKKPLFYFSGEEGIVFASEINALLKAPYVDKAIDWAALQEYLQNRYVSGPQTFFTGVKKLPAGSFAIWSDGELTISQFYRPPVAQSEPKRISLEIAAGQFSELFQDAVRLRMRSDVSVGAFLSGGVDSSAVVATMAGFTSTPVKTYSVGFPQERFSELAHAKEVAAAFGCDHHELMLEEEDFIENWPKAVLHRGAPLSETADIPIFLLSREAKKSVTVVLTGEGADEVFAGYPKHRAERWADWYQRLVPPGLHSTFLDPVSARLPESASRLATLLSAFGERSPGQRMFRWFGNMSEREREALYRGPAVSLPAKVAPSEVSGSSLRRVLLFDQVSWLPDNLLERADRMMMAWSIEGRMPFMDTEIAKFAAGIPDHLHLQHRRGKTVLREAMKNVIPRHLLERRKVGFRVPVHLWMRHRLRKPLTDMLCSGDSIVRSFCNPVFVDRVVAEHLEEQKNHEKLLWGLLNLEIFLREFRPSM